MRFLLATLVLALVLLPARTDTPATPAFTVKEVHDVAYRESEQGAEVLAVGDEIGPLFRRLRPAERQKVVVGHPEPW